MKPSTNSIEAPSSLAPGSRQCDAMTGYASDEGVRWTHRCVRPGHVGERGKHQFEPLTPPQPPPAYPVADADPKLLHRAGLDLILALEAAARELEWCGSSRQAIAAREAVRAARKVVR